MSEESAAPMPSVIITAGSVQHMSVDKLVNSATVGAAVSRKASFVLLISIDKSELRISKVE